MVSASLASTLLLAASAFALPVRPIRRTAPSSADILVFQFADVLENLETEFYTQALAKFKPSDFVAAGFNNVNIPTELFTTIQSDESTHTSVIEEELIALGQTPLGPTCKFNFGNVLNDVKTMAATARVIENIGVSAYLGGANLLQDKDLLVAAASILSVEARHQSILNVLNDASSIPAAFDVPIAPSQILAMAGPFISGCDLGINATQTLTVTNTGTIAPGTSLTFSSPGIPSDTSGLTCQMMTGGAPFALALPFTECVVPKINGPVYIYVVNGTQPLQNSQNEQFSASILAGPTLAFIDSIPETLGEVVAAAPATIEATSTISPTAASALLAAASPNATEGSGGNASGSAASPTATASASFSTATGSVSNGAIDVLGWSFPTASSAGSTLSGAPSTLSGLTTATGSSSAASATA